MENKAKPNIIIFLVDAMRASSVGCYGFDFNTTPNIDNLAKAGIIFEKAFTSINATDPSITSITTGKYPINHGIHNHADKVTKQEINYFVKNNKMLQSYLKEEGYKTFGLDWLGRWHKKGYDEYLGVVEAEKKKVIYQKLEKLIRKIKPLHKLFLKIYFSEKLKRFTKSLKLYQDGRELADKAIKIIKNTDEPFFTFIHFWDTHAPYHCPSNLDEEFYVKGKTKSSLKDLIRRMKSKETRAFYEALFFESNNDIDRIIAKYYGSIKYCDKMIGVIVDALKESKKLENTLIFVTADHGESLIEHNILFDHHGLYEQSLRVPLIIHYPKLGKGKVVKELVMNMDITPTILDILNIKDIEGLDGMSLINIMKKKVKREYIFAEENYLQKKRCVRSDRYKYIYPQKGFEGCIRCGYVHGGVEEVYDLNEDPKEEKNIVNAKEDIVKEFKKAGTEFFKDKKEKKKIASEINSIKI